MWRNLLGFAGCVPVVVLLGALSFERWRWKRSRGRLPISDKLLRPPGYTLSCEFDDLMDGCQAFLFGSYMSAVVAVGAWRFSPNDVNGNLVWLSVFGAGAAVCAVVAWRKVRMARVKRLGMRGEQAVAEQLQAVAPIGYYAFHECPRRG